MQSVWACAATSSRIESATLTPRAPALADDDAEPAAQQHQPLWQGPAVLRTSLRASQDVMAALRRSGVVQAAILSSNASRVHVVHDAGAAGALWTATHACHLRCAAGLPALHDSGACCMTPAVPCALACAAVARRPADGAVDVPLVPACLAVRPRRAWWQQLLRVVGGMLLLSGAAAAAVAAGSGEVRARLSEQMACMQAA